MTSASTGTSSAGLGRLNSVLAQRYFSFYTACTIFLIFFPLDQYESPFIFLSTKRLPQEQTEKKDQPAITTSNSQSMTAGEQEAKQRRK